MSLCKNRMISWLYRSKWLVTTMRGIWDRFWVFNSVLKKESITSVVLKPQEQTEPQNYLLRRPREVSISSLITFNMLHNFILPIHSKNNTSHILLKDTGVWRMMRRRKRRRICCIANCVVNKKGLWCVNRHRSMANEREKKDLMRIASSATNKVSPGESVWHEDTRVRQMRGRKRKWERTLLHIASCGKCRWWWKCGNESETSKIRRSCKWAEGMRLLHTASFQKTGEANQSLEFLIT